MSGISSQGPTEKKMQKSLFFCRNSSLSTRLFGVGGVWKSPPHSSPSRKLPGICGSASPISGDTWSSKFPGFLWGGKRTATTWRISRHG